MTSFFKITIVLIVAFLLHINGEAQVIYENKNDTVKLFSLAEESFNPDTTPTMKSVVHFAWLQAIRGQYPFFYEHNIGAHLGLSAGLGFTYADLFRRMHSDIVFDQTLGKMKLGLHTEALAKYYFSGLAIEDYYLGFNFKFSTYNYENYELGFDRHIQERRYQYVLIFGTQFNEIGSRIVYDYYAGVGWTSLFADDEQLTNINGNFTPTPITSFIDRHAVIRIGIKMGIKIN